MTNPDSIPEPPGNLAEAGRRLWHAVVTEFEFGEHDLVILAEACRCRDRIEQLAALVDQEGLMSSTSQGPRVHPALVEERAQRQMLGRLLASLAVLGVVDEDVPAARGYRGTYKPRKV